MRDCGSNSLNHGLEGGDCCGGARGGGRGATGGMNEGSTYYTEKSYWGATKKASYADQCKTPLMYGLRKTSMNLRPWTG
jgi:hypothetical protein